MKAKVKVRLKGTGNPAEEIPVTTEYIKLDAFLKFSNISETGGMARMMIDDGEVLVNGETCFMRGKKLRPGDEVSVGGKKYKVIRGRNENRGNET